MKNEVVVIERECIDELAADYFSSICGFDRDRERYRAMLLEGQAVRDKISESIKVRAVVSSYGKEAVNGKSLCLDGVEFECDVLSFIDIQSIRQIYAYILTSVDAEWQCSSVLEGFYADTWGTAYIDAGRDILRSKLKEQYEKENKPEQVFISDSFAPGFYGMDITLVGSFFKILDSDKIGVKMTDSGMMLPIKSCAGFFIIVDDEGQLPGDDCKSCCSNTKGCHFCRARTRMKL